MSFSLMIKYSPALYMEKVMELEHNQVYDHPGECGLEYTEQTVTDISTTCVVVIDLGPVVQKVGSANHQINHYPVDKEIDFPNIYPLDSDLSGGQRYTKFEQPEPDLSVTLQCRL